jgi:hypothetical protein
MNTKLGKILYWVAMAALVGFVAYRFATGCT